MTGVITLVEESDIMEKAVISGVSSTGVGSDVTTILGPGSLPSNASSICTKKAWTCCLLAMASSKQARWACAQAWFAWYLSHWPSRLPPGLKQVLIMWLQPWQFKQLRVEQSDVLVAGGRGTVVEVMVGSMMWEFMTGWEGWWIVGMVEW